MKKILKACKAWLLYTALLLPVALFAKDDNAEKTKAYTKIYDISSSDKIAIENSFGRTKFITWGESKVQVDVEIKAEASTDTRAQKLLETISIMDGKTNGGVYFKTVIDSRGNNGSMNKKTNIEINYTVHLPATNQLDLKNQFGDTYLPDYSGPVEIEEKFGNLTAGNLLNVKELSVQFGGAKIEGIGNGKLKVGYSSFSVKKITGDVDVSFDFSDGTELNLDENVKSLTVYTNYSSIKINTAKNLSADFDVETHFGDFSNRTDYQIKEEKEKESEWKKPQFDYHYYGRAANGDIKVKLKSNFGSITLR